MNNKKNLLIPFLAATVLSSDLIYASEDTNQTLSNEWTLLPYAFSTNVTGIAGGIAAIRKGLIQPQTTLAAGVFGGLKEDIIVNGENKEANFSGGFVTFTNLLLPKTDRLFFSLIGLKSYFPKNEYYIDGSNDSNSDDVLLTSGHSDFVNTTFKYVLPLGEGLENPQGTYTLQDGFAMNREGYGNGTPFVTGITAIGVKTFWAMDSYDNWQDYTPWLSEEKHSWETNGLRLFLTHDNTDYDLNPSRGYHFELHYSKDFGKGDSLQSWDSIEFKYNHYFNLDTFSFTRQNVLAFSFWTAYSPSWETDSEIAPGIAAHRPPLWEGARLGGMNKMRAYDQNRFSDKAGVYGTAEYRVILDWNPLKNNSFIPVDVDWFQVVAFVEAGRVNDQYNFDLLSDMKYDAGISLRAMVSQLPIRVDVAYGDEGTNLWVMIQHPFDF